MTLEENIDTLVDKRAYINNEQPELSWPPNAQELTSEITKPPDALTDFLTELLMPSNTKKRR